MVTRAGLLLLLIGSAVFSASEAAAFDEKLEIHSRTVKAFLQDVF
ncbi:hypothetical protein [Neorhizobium sp. DT-125]